MMTACLDLKSSPLPENIIVEELDHVFDINFNEEIRFRCDQIKKVLDLRIPNDSAIEVI